ncbi:unnamed protein product [Rhizoctonia solani]|uniref:PNPLA domain-containing protein n=1 Tax=Rhizoctonia solani TaxID=456999 RepID=A0A8H3BM21_9AGAM|nr:unnamed protein product [Rhizoctonia solani]
MSVYTLPNPSLYSLQLANTSRSSVASRSRIGKVGDSGPLRLLCLDGGGVRGLSSLFLLKEVLHRVAKSGKFTGDGSGKILPCEYFDMICGTSTGGLIAIMLGKLRMTVDEAIDKYLELSKHIFSKKKWIWKEGRYCARNLEWAIQDIVAERAMVLKLPGYQNHVTKPRDRGKAIMMRGEKPDPKMCKVFVCAVNTLDTLAEVNVRTYEVEKNQREDFAIWEAARATSAAPYFFKPLVVSSGGDRKIGGTYIDGGVGSNNPIRRLLNESRREFPGRKPSLVLSLGTGIKDITQLPRARGIAKILQLLSLLRVLGGIALDCERIHQEVYQEFKSEKIYFRLNVDRGMHQIGLDEWNRKDAIHQCTKSYIQRPEVSSHIDQIVASFFGESN